MPDDLRQRCIDALVAEFLIDSESAAPLADEVLAVRDEELQAWRERAEEAEAAIARVRERHKEYEGRCMACLERCSCFEYAEQTPEGLWRAWNEDCSHGNAVWPCPTIAALDAPEAERG